MQYNYTQKNESEHLTNQQHETLKTLLSAVNVRKRARATQKYGKFRLSKSKNSVFGNLKLLFLEI